ncbi:MAG: hypothetical protein LBO73_02170 [Holosporaceae bacterium]|nr:hypothetical protein [Holosporaceae bacterium]
MKQQEIFDFPEAVRLDWSDFIESEENREAIMYLAGWPNWSGNGLIICGESGTGKTHLAALWAQTAGAVYVLKESLNYSPRDLFEAECNFVIDNFDDLTGRKNYEWMFDFLNISVEKNRFFLILSRTHPSARDIEPEDLKSRLFALPCVSIRPPEDDLLLKVSKKIAGDLGMTLSDDVMLCILNIIDRRVTAVADVLRTLNKLSLRRKKSLTAAFVKSCLKDSNS